MLRLRETKSYSVRVVNCALDILELLQSSEAPLKAKEIATNVMASRSTTYRVLRTLAARGYVIEELDARFSARPLNGSKQLECEMLNPLMPSIAASRDWAVMPAEQIVQLMLMILESYKKNALGFKNLLK